MSASRAWRAARAREITECARARSSALSARNARARAPQPMGGECECACMRGHRHPPRKSTKIRIQASAVVTRRSTLAPSVIDLSVARSRNARRRRLACIAERCSQLVSPRVK